MSSSRLFARNNSYKRRKTYNKPIKRFIFVAFEGSKTEPKYFDKLDKLLEEQSLYQTKVIIVDKKPKDHKSHPKQVRDGLIQFYDNEAISYVKLVDELWIVIDIDNHFEKGKTCAQEQFKTFLESLITSDGKPIRAAISHPSFELWEILHVEDIEKLDMNAIRENKKNTNRKPHIKTLREDLYAGLKDPNSLTLDMVNRAIYNAESPSFCQENKQILLQTGTTVYKLVKRLME